MKLDMNAVRGAMYAMDYSRGMEYYRSGRVSGMRETIWDGFSRVDCTVRGSQLYRVMFRESRLGGLEIDCDCPRFADVGHCKHVAAAMIAYVMNPPVVDTTESDYKIRQILKAYANKDTRSGQTEGNARLVPAINVYDAERGEYPSLSFRVGTERIYAVKNIKTFLDNVHQRKTVALGKKLTLDHSIEQFDRQSQALIRILMNEFQEFRTVSRSWYVGYYGSSPLGYQKSVITLTGDAFERFFSLMEGQTLEVSSNRKVILQRGDPQVTIRLDKGKNGARIQVETGGQLHFFGGVGRLYACSDTALMACGEDFRDRVYPLLREGQASMQISFQDLPSFTACVLPELQDLVKVEDPDGLLQEYIPQECTPCFYFDIEDDTLLLKLTYRYGDQELTDWEDGNGQVRRDIRAERQARELAQRFFQQTEDGRYVLDGEEAVYEFLTGGVDRFREKGEVFATDRLRGRRILPAPAAVGVSVSDGMLNLTVDTGEFPPQELEALYQSMLRRKKYHRLSDGRFLTMEDGSYEKLAEMAHMLQLPAKALAQGSVQLPAFRALYIDSLLSGGNDLRVTRDRQFREMVRSFKSVEDSDYALPPKLEDVLRPYQKTGFQWLKTLESCGFGGILADEMGLGKTAQVIAFFASQTRREHPNLVVCPASLILNWGEECAKFAPELKVTLILGTAAERRQRIAQAEGQDVWVTSYELLRQDVELYQAKTFDCCVLDEGQHIKNQSTLNSRAVKAINCRQRFVLTGTPVENRLSELWNLFDFLMPGYLYSHSAFVEKLEKPIVKSKNPEASEQLQRLVKPFLLRRVKKDVLKELPPKIEHVRRISLTEQERKVYCSAANNAKGMLDGGGKLQILAALTQLRQICCDPNLCFENYTGPASKLEACLELCAGMVENGHQILLFSQFTSMLDRIRQRLEDMGISSYTLQGSTPKERRAQLVKSFNAGGASVFLISLKAGGTGLNLTAADVVIHFDPWWNLAAQNQATDRAHRIGQTQHVQVYKLIAQGTIEEKILELQERKSQLMDLVTGAGGEGILSMSKEDLLALLE